MTKIQAVLLLSLTGFFGFLVSCEKSLAQEPSSSISITKEKLFPLWALENASIPAPEVNPFETKKTLIAVIDTGVALDHPALGKHLWKNPGETGLDELGRDKATNGIDDDHNGFVDDVHGWNFVSSNNQIHDLHGHGTHVAGIIVGDPIHPTGVRGVSPHSELMVLKYFDKTTSNMKALQFSLEAFQYAIQMGAQIINYSGGGPRPSDLERHLIAEARRKGIVVVAAAGNEGLNADQFQFYPSGYFLDNIVSVAAIDSRSRLISSSNFGKESVDIAAPGKEIFSTLPGGRYGYMTGTSQATAFVTGALAELLYAYQGRKPFLEVIQELYLNSEKLEGETYKSIRTQSKLNLAKSLDKAKSSTLAPVAKKVSSRWLPARRELSEKKAVQLASSL